MARRTFSVRQGTLALICAFVALGFIPRAVAATQADEVKADKAQAPRGELKYSITPTKRWQKDVDTQPLEPGDEHWVLVDDSTIDIIVTRANGEFLSEAINKGAKPVVDQLMKSKNLIQAFVSDEPARASDIKLEGNSPAFRILSFRTNYNYGKTPFVSQERYFLFPGKGLHAVLRWNSKSDAKQVAAAVRDFSTIKVQQVADGGGK